VDCARATDKPNGVCCRAPDRTRLLEALTGDGGGAQGNDAAALCDDTELAFAPVFRNQ
jgi:hypothetical protein